MKPKQLFILGLVLIVLFAINTFQKFRAAAPVKQIHNEEWHPFVPPEKIARLVVSKPGMNTLTLVKDDKDWKIKNLQRADADKQKVSDLISQINQMKAELRAEGESLYSRFGISDKESYRLEIIDHAGTALIDFFIGSRRQGKGIFIRLPGKNKIYAAADDLLSFLGVPVGEDRVDPVFFADLRIVPETFDQIQRLETAGIINGEKKTQTAIERNAVPGSEWKFVSKQIPFVPGHEKIEDYLNRLIGTQADTMAAEAPEFKSEYEIILRDQHSKILKLQFSRDGRDWFIRRENSAALYRVSETVFQDLKVRDGQFIAVNPFQIEVDEKAVVELTGDGRTETFSKASGWASAAAILDAASKLNFLDMSPEPKEVKAAPSHQMKIIRPGKPEAVINFYIKKPGQDPIEVTLAGQPYVFKVSRAFFESIFVPKTPPVEENLT